MEPYYECIIINGQLVIKQIPPEQADELLVFDK